MKRRRFLAAAGAPLAGLAGCLADDPLAGGPNRLGPTPDYEECPNEVVYYRDLPGPLRREVDAATTDGPYEAEEVLLADAMDVEEAYLLKDGDYYRPVVSGNGTRLELVGDEEPELRDERDLRVENPRDAGEPREVTATLATAAGGTLIEGTATVPPGGRESLGGTGRVGTHDLTVERGDGERASHEVPVGPNWYGIVVAADTLEYTQGVADRQTCSWSR